MTSARVGDDEDQVALGRAPVRSMIARCVSSRQELGDRALDLAAGLEREIGEALRPEPPGALGQLVDLAPGDAAPCPGATIALTRPPAASASSKTPKPEATACRPASTSAGAEVDQLHPEAQVRLVRAEALDRLVVGAAAGTAICEDRPVRDGRARDLDRHRLDEAP